MIDISSWGLGKIMQLPDWCFGSKYAVCVEGTAYDDELHWDISEVALPERFVLWELLWDRYGVSAVTCYIRLALGDQLPTSNAQMMALQPLIAGLGAQGADPRQIRGNQYHDMHIVNLRMPVQASGRRLVLESYAASEKNGYSRVIAVVSTIPRSIPEWLCLELDKSLM